MTMKQIEINVPEAVVPYANVEGIIRKDMVVSLL